LSETYHLKIFVSTHPRTKKALERNNFSINKYINFVSPFGFLDYVKLQMNAKCVISDSGTITEESSILNFPAINIRETHERQEGMEEGSVMLTGLNIDRILMALEILETQSRGGDRSINIVSKYKAKNFSEKVLRIILSYTDYVDRVIWKRYD
jgi:UDP-N-acetylglucosamine 2-epimerase